MHLVLDPRAMAHDLVAPRHQPAQPLGCRIRRPDLGQDSRPHRGWPASRRRPCRSSHGHGRSPSPAADWRSPPAPRTATAPATPPCSCRSPRSPPRRLARSSLPKPSSAVRVMSTRPACRNRPSSQITTSPKVRWMSIPITRRIPALLSITIRRERRGDTTTTDPRSRRNRASRRGGQLLTRARSSSFNIGLPAPSCSRCLCPGWSHHTRYQRTQPASRHRHPHTGYQCQ